MRDFIFHVAERPVQPVEYTGRVQAVKLVHYVRQRRSLIHAKDLVDHNWPGNGSIPTNELLEFIEKMIDSMVVNGFFK